MSHDAATLVLVNPRAARGALLGDDEPTRRRLSQAWGAPTTVRVPDSVDALRREIGAAPDTVIVAGGDGTLHHAVNVLEKRHRLGVLPLGTANDFARALGIPDDLDRAIVHLSDRRIRTVDAIVMNGQRICSGGGFGLPAATVHTVARLRSVGCGQKALRALDERIYNLAVVPNILPQPKRYQATLSWVTPTGVTRTWRTSLNGAFIMNQPHLAGHMPVSPASRRDDGVVELCVIRPMTGPEATDTLWRLSRGLPSRFVLPIPVVSADVRLDAPAPVFADGEACGFSRSYQIGVDGGCLSIM